MRKFRKTRESKIEIVKHSLLQNSFPRLQISMILLFTASAGFLASFLLLYCGISSMALRYPLVISFAYCVFLLLLRIWLWMQSSDSDSVADLSNLDFADLPDSSANDIGTGFKFDGADGSWGEGVSSSGGNSILDGLGFDLDEIGLLIIAVAAIIGGLLASLYIIYIAPILLAEILVDGILITGLYRRVKKIEQRYWLKTAVKKTLLPAILAALFFSIAGFAMQKIAPEAHSIGEIWHQISGN